MCLLFTFNAIYAGVNAIYAGTIEMHSFFVIMINGYV